MAGTEVITLRLLDGEPAEMAEAQSKYSIRPPGKSYDDKFLFGVFRGREMIGCVDRIRGWPVSTTAHVDLITQEDNLRSRGVAERCGFTLEGVHRNMLRGPDGELRHRYVYARLPGAALRLPPHAPRPDR